MELQLKLADENSDTKSLAASIRQDPLMAAELLSTAMAMKFGAGQAIKTLEHAITYIGRQAILDMTMVAGIKGFKFRTKKFGHDFFWESAKLTGSIADFLARKFGLGLEPDEVFLAGSLCNIGKAVGAICLPEEIDRIVEMLSNSQIKIDWSDAERELGIPSHGMLGEIASTIWGLPPYITEAAARHHDLEFLSKGDVFGITHTAALANQICHWIHLEPEKINDRLLSSLAERLDLNDSGLDLLVGEFMAANSKTQ
jgi:HD-like signal output (HDOD) protein